MVTSHTKYREHIVHRTHECSGEGTFFQRARALPAAGEHSEPSQREGFARSAEQCTRATSE